MPHFAAKPYHFGITQRRQMKLLRYFGNVSGGVYSSQEKPFNSKATLVARLDSVIHNQVTFIYMFLHTCSLAVNIMAGTD